MATKLLLSQLPFTRGYRVLLHSPLFLYKEKTLGVLPWAKKKKKKINVVFISMSAFPRLFAYL